MSLDCFGLDQILVLMCLLSFIHVFYMCVFVFGMHSCLVRVCQLRIARDNLRKSPTATPTLDNPWSGPENVPEGGANGEITEPEAREQRGEAWAGFLGGAEDHDEGGAERSWGAGLFGMVGHGGRDAGDD